MSEKITKKYVNKQLGKINDLKGCKGLLRAIKEQEQENNKIIARNARLANELQNEEEFIQDLANSTDIRTNWNIGLQIAREKVYEKMDELL